MSLSYWASTPFKVDIMEDNDRPGEDKSDAPANKEDFLGVTAPLLDEGPQKRPQRVSRKHNQQQQQQQPQQQQQQHPESKRKTSKSSKSNKDGPSKPKSVVDVLRSRRDTDSSAHLAEVDSLPSLKHLNIPRQGNSSSNTLQPLPSTFNQEPSFVRRLSVSLNTEVRFKRKKIN